MATTYTAVLPRPDGVPAPLLVRIVVMREDGKPLSREELEALVVAYPPHTEDARGTVDRAIARAPSKTAGKAPAKPKATATKPGKPTTKRAAAKRP
jgi:hypothetical protein